MNDVILSKSSSSEELKQYFTTILKLSQSNDEFPINLDEVWMLVYGQKSDAVYALTNNEQFIEGVDYKVLRKIPQNPNGGRPTNEYHLSVSCLEYFIARKVRSVFDVYRQVFHKSVQQFQVPTSFKEALLLAAKQQEQIEEQQRQIEQKERKIEAMQPKADFAEAAFKSEGYVDIGQSTKILGLPFGRNTLFRMLRNKGIFFNDRNEPKQQYVKAGYFKLTQLPPIKRISHPDLITMKVLVTQKGLAFINKLFGGSMQQPKPTAITR